MPGNLQDVQKPKTQNITKKTTICAAYNMQRKLGANLTNEIKMIDEGDEQPVPKKSPRALPLVVTSHSTKLSERRIRETRRSWPQTEFEAEFRYGITVRGKQTFEGSNSLEDKLNSLVYDPEVNATPNLIVNSQVINWDHLSEGRVSALERSTVWNGGSGLFDIEQDNEELARISALFNVKKLEHRPSRTNKISVLDQRRATTVSVAMKRMRLTTNKFGKLAWALRDMNESYLTQTAVEILYSSQLWATPKEIDEMKQKLRDGYELADPDALLWFLATSVPDMSLRVSAMTFRYEFDESIGEMIRATSILKAASMEIVSSELLKRLMRVILLIGNCINETFGGQPAWGIKISSLSKLSSTKTTDKALSVLDCIVSYLDQMAPEVFGAADECTCTPSAAKYAFKNQNKILKDARKGVQMCAKLKMMSKFVDSSSRKLDNIEREIRTAKESFDKCLSHFCIPQDSMDSDEFFDTLAQFFDHFEKAVSNLEAKQKQSSLPPAPTVKSGLQNPNFMKQRRESAFSFSSWRDASGSVDINRSLAPRPSIFGRMRPLKS